MRFESLPSFSQISEKWQETRKNNEIPKGFVEMGTKMNSVIAPYQLKPATWSSVLLSIRDPKLKRCQCERRERKHLFSTLTIGSSESEFVLSSRANQDKMRNETPVLTELHYCTISAFIEQDHHLILLVPVQSLALMRRPHSTSRYDRDIGGSGNKETECDNSATFLHLRTYILYLQKWFKQFEDLRNGNFIPGTSSKVTYKETV